MPIGTKERENMPDHMFGVPGKKQLPLYESGMLNKKHIRLAWDMVDRTKDLTDAERTEARRRILDAAKQAHMDTSSWEKAATDDIIVATVTILDSVADSADKPMRVRLKMTRANVVNENNRLYPTEVLQDAIQRMKDTYIAQGRAIGESPHPRVLKSTSGKPVFDTQASNSVWKHLDVTMDADGWVYTDVEILRTAKGRDIEALILQGVPVGDSMRAIGRWTQRQINGKTVDVATYLDIPASDAVMNEATAGSQVVGILDSLQPIADSQLATIMAAGPPEEESDVVKFCVLLDGQAITDSVQFTDQPIDPSTGEQLTPQDPDGDGDVDFYTNAKGEVYMTDKNMRHESHAHVTLRRLPPDDDGDNYMLARQWQRQRKTQPATDGTLTQTTAATDSRQGDDQMPTIEELLAHPKFQEAIDKRAQEIAKPALDSIQTQEQDRARVAAKAEAKTHLLSRLDGMKDKLGDKTLSVITDSIGDRPESKESVDAMLDSILELLSKTGAATSLTSLGFGGAVNQATQARVEVTHEPKPWQPVVDSLVKSFDEYGLELGHEPDKALRKHNKPLVDKILAKFEKDNGFKALTDSQVFMDSIGTGEIADSISVTTAQLFNQATVLEAIIVQAFQDVESSQWMMIDTFDGGEWRIPVETYTSAATFDPVSQVLDILVGEGLGIPEANTDLTWLSFAPRWRRNAVSISEDVSRALLTGPAKYPAIARAMYHLGYEKRRRLDLAAYYEMVLASDEYNPTVVASETAAAVTAVSNGTNVTYKYQLDAAAGSTFPVVRSRQKNEYQANGQIATVTTNPFTVTLAGHAQVAGYLDATGNIQPSTATYAVDYENGIVYFNAASAVSGTALPTFAYSASTNYDTWHYTVPGTTTADQYYNTLLQQITNTSAKMGSSPRFKKPNLAIMSLNAASYIENAAMWYKLQLPEGSEFMPQTDNMFGRRSGVNFGRTNAPWGPGDGRILMSQKGSTRYGIQTPYAIEGPYPKYDSNQNLIDAKAWMGKENSVLCTPQVTDINGNILNPVSRTIRILA